MLKEYVQIINKLGLHARASSLFVQTASQFKSQVNVVFQGNTINGKSILGLMMLAAPKDSWIALEVDGPDEKKAITALMSLIQNYFGEEG